jgi:hypothetical protein
MVEKEIQVLLERGGEGGGGATAAGTISGPGTGNGGTGATTSITGSPVGYAGVAEEEEEEVQ